MACFANLFLCMSKKVRIFAVSKEFTICYEIIQLPMIFNQSYNIMPIVALITILIL